MCILLHILDYIFDHVIQKKWSLTTEIRRLGSNILERGGWFLRGNGDELHSYSETQCVSTT